ncbi:hypothetical protein IEI94_15125 [Halomonas sp. ML-15]|uniref:hypothetical protein n=1 Tax=Halomonas sp. ML-15 TaxID=2773305 RepID=UPI0017471EEE|nr:hypothetical protein [Halomonas sp. ML-15]MBD3897188.1 hypothetical protein [Halomonas sp. ML-15]
MGAPFSREEIQTYFDEETKSPLVLCFDPHALVIDGVNVQLEGVPLLKDERAGEIHYPDKTKALIEFFVEEALKEGKAGVRLMPRGTRNVRYPFAEKFDFDYSHIDYEYIPGLVRPCDEGFLTPVYFNLAVLNKYSQHPEYTLNLFSETYGDIRKPGEWDIAFGINRHRKVIMWLGDIDRLPENEKYYLRSENVPSDHDIHSEFYNAQIEVQFSDPSVQSSAFHLRSDLQAFISEKFGYDVYSLNGEVSGILENIERPVFWEEKHVSAFFNSLNQIFVESISVPGLRGSIDALGKGYETKSKKGLKLFEMWCDGVAGVESPSDVALPFFVLYDLRIICSHLQSAETRQEKHDLVCARLGLKKGSGYEAIYNVLIEKIVGSYKAILSAIDR